MKPDPPLEKWFRLGISQDGLGALRDAREGVERMSREGGRDHQIQARARTRKPAIAR